MRMALVVAGIAAAGLEAQEPIDVGRIEVTVGSRASDRAARLTRSVEVLGRDRLTTLPVRTVAEALEWALGVDVQSRSPASADLSIRGSGMEEVLVLVDGIPVSDAQTGHFHLDLPIPLDQVERIEVLRGPAAALYGSDAVGGVVNVVTRTRVPVSVELSHPNPATLDAASERVMGELQQFAGVFDIQSDQDRGMEEVQLRLKPAARTLGLTLDEVARQVRAAFFGQEALRVQRGREDVRVYVRLPEQQRDAVSDVEDYRIRVPGGAVPLREVAVAGFGEAPSVIRRKDGRRVATVTADVNPSVVTGQEVTQRLQSEILPALQADYPQLTYEFGGQQEEQRESFGALGRGFVLALMVMYALLAVPFRSYLQPFVIMASVPFGIVGAMIGHLILGLPVGLLSLFGIIGLSGVVVNDSLVMMDFINELRLKGESMREAIIEGAKRRFRPILLTSITTFLGVAPLVLETSVQAQFLIPMAASLGFGIIFGTAILMLLVPALAWLEYEITLWFQTRVMGREESEVHLVHHSQRA